MSDTLDCQRIMQSEFFSELSEEECALLLPYLKKETAEQGDLVVREDQKVDRMFLVVKGRVRREKILGITLGAAGLEAWQEKELFEVKEPGGSFCEYILMEETSAKVDWVAVDTSEIWTLSCAAFQNIVAKKEEALGRKLLLALCRALHGQCAVNQKQLAIGFEREQLVRHMHLERKKIKAMHHIARSTAANNVSQTLDTILEACMDCLDVAKGSIMIFDKGMLRVEAAFGQNKDKILGQKQVINESSVSGRCFVQQKPVFIEDIALEKGLTRSPDPSQYWNNSLISMPLVSLSGESIGVLNISKTTNEVFTEDDLKILEDLTLEASAALGHEISLALMYRNFQETYVGLKKAKKQLGTVESNISKIMQGSWPSIS